MKNRIDMKPLPIIATVFLGLGVIMFGIMLLQSEETTTSMSEGIGLGLDLIGDAFLISCSAVLCMIFSIISICKGHWRAWSYVMLALCLAWFAWMVLIVTG